MNHFLDRIEAPSLPRRVTSDMASERPGLVAPDDDDDDDDEDGDNDFLVDDDDFEKKGMVKVSCVVDGGTGRARQVDALRSADRMRCEQYEPRSCKLWYRDEARGDE